MTTPTRRARLREALAALCHDQWSGWMEHLFSVAPYTSGAGVSITADNARRWKTQIATPYAHLSAGEQDSDRKEADRILAVIDAEGPPEELAQLAAEREALAMKLAACTTAALGNTPGSASARIPREHPYFSATYQDVCDAVDREMAHRSRADGLERELAAVRDGAMHIAREIGTVATVLGRTPDAPDAKKQIARLEFWRSALQALRYDMARWPESDGVEVHDTKQ